MFSPFYSEKSVMKMNNMVVKELFPGQVLKIPRSKDGSSSGKWDAQSLPKSHGDEPKNTNTRNYIISDMSEMMDNPYILLPNQVKQQ